MSHPASAARPSGIRAPAPPPPHAPAHAADAADTPATYEGVLAEGDRLFDDGDYHNAVRAYERAWRVAYRGKLATDKAALDARLAKARAARDARKR